MIRRAAQRNCRRAAHHAGQQIPEPQRVLRGEPRREQILMAVVIDELGLHARDGVGQILEGGDDPSQLQRLREILGVEDRDDLTGREVQAVVAGLGFGARFGGRHQHDRDRVGILAIAGGADRDVVIGLQQEEHLELVLRILQGGHRADEVAHHLELPVCGHQDGVAGSSSSVSALAASSVITMGRELSPSRKISTRSSMVSR